MEEVRKWLYNGLIMKSFKIGIAFLAFRGFVRNANMAYHRAPCKQTNRFRSYIVLHFVDIKSKRFVTAVVIVTLQCRMF
jgi:hypothetical protein